MERKKIAVLIPCYNEEKTIDAVIDHFQQELPEAHIYVYDNNSRDNTVAKASCHKNVSVLREKKQGKGHVVRRMFSDIEADIYILVDGDNTYDAKSVHKMINTLETQHLDMVVGARVSTDIDSYRLGHSFGNWLFNKVITLLFGRQFMDIFSGYRVFSRRFVKSFPCLSTGFEIETEMSVHALEMHLAVEELPTPYGARPAGSFSKLNTYVDGFRILKTIFKLLKESQPFALFFLCFLSLTFLALLLFMPILLTYINTGLVPRFPTVILITSLTMLAFLCLFSGIILDSVSRMRLEKKRLSYLAIKA